MRRISIILVVVGALLLLLGLLLTIEAGKSSMPSYLAGWLFWSALPLGALPLVMLLDLTGPGAGWGLEPILRRMLLLLPIAALLIIPILLRPQDLFGWTNGQGFTTPFGKAWMGYWPFVVRNIVYFALWFALSLLFVRPPRQASVGTRRGLAAAGLLLYGLSATLASVDWAVGVEPDWFSAEYPLLLVATQAAIAISIALLLAGDLWRRTASQAASAFLLIASAAWIFTQFVQFLVIWSADKVTDIPWYLHRWNFGSGIAVLIAFVFGFILPLLTLLLPSLRRRRFILPSMAVLILCVQAMTAFWLITPSLRHYFTVTGMDVLEFFAIGGVVLGLALWPLSRSKAALHG